MFPAVNTSDTTPVVNPQVVSPAEVTRKATETGHPHAASALAVTVPTITVDLTGTHWHTMGSDFWWNTGTVAIRLRQEVFIASDISMCARGIWAVHENLHVADNRTVLNSLAAQVAADSSLQDIFSGRRFPRSDFAMVQDAVINIIGGIFRRLTGHHATARDTRAEYSRVNQDIIRSCPGPHFHTVVSGENLSLISEFYYGTQRHYMKIYNQNRGVIGANPNLIRPNQRLEIPRV